MFSIAGGWVFSFYLIFSLFFFSFLILFHFFSFYLFFSFHLIFDEKMHLDASCRRLQSWFKSSFVTLGKSVKRSKNVQRIRCSHKGTYECSGCEPNDSFANAMMGMKPFLSNKEHLTLDFNLKTASKNAMYLTVAC